MVVIIDKKLCLPELLMKQFQAIFKTTQKLKILTALLVLSLTNAMLIFCVCDNANEFEMNFFILSISK